MIIEKMSLYEAFTEAISSIKSDVSIVIPCDKIDDMLRICVTNCIGDEYEINCIDIDNEYYNYYVVSFLKIDDIINIFIEKGFNENKQIYYYNECDLLYIDTDCNNEILGNMHTEELHIFDTHF